MEVVAKFEKVSFEQFKKDVLEVFKYDDETIKNIYNDIKLPKRSTKSSAGYDFFIPYELTIANNTCSKIPTGIRCNMKDGWVLQIYPRSGHGFKYGLHLANTVGIIDADYYNADNEGHIMVKIVNNSILNYKPIHFDYHDAFCQGIFIPFGITSDDNATGIRHGGFGSTDKK